MMRVETGGRGMGKTAAHKAWIKAVEQHNDRLKKRSFWLSIKPAKDCLFGRRNGHCGKIIFGYSIRLRLFRREII